MSTTPIPRVDNQMSKYSGQKIFTYPQGFLLIDLLFSI